MLKLSFLQALDKEYAFWMTQRAISITKEGQTHVLNVYNVSNSVPRPESYLEDFETASKLPSSDDQLSFYANIASGAETGWDFSTRWLPEYTTDLELISTRDIVPVDLNSLLYLVETTLAKLHAQNGDTATIVAQYTIAATMRKQALKAILWDPESLRYRDFNSKRMAFQHESIQFYASNFLPFWAHVDTDLSASMVDTMIDNDNMPLAGYPGGVPTSLVSSGQQWDFPNAWPPLQLFLIEAMDNLAQQSGSQRASWVSFDLARRWMTSNFCAWKLTSKNGTGGDMFEKYDVNRVGLPGGGGEYAVQTGFGWTNGVVLTLLSRFSLTQSLPKDILCLNT